jgi:hypothetical protein
MARPGSRVGDQVDALTFREHEDDGLPVVVEVPQVRGEQRRRGLDQLEDRQ